jgi:hypothetical protein
MFNGYEAAVSQNEKVLDMECGDSCTTYVLKANEVDT